MAVHNTLQDSSASCYSPLEVMKRTHSLPCPLVNDQPVPFNSASVKISRYPKAFSPASCEGVTIDDQNFD